MAFHSSYTLCCVSTFTHCDLLCGTHLSKNADTLFFVVLLVHIYSVYVKVTVMVTARLMVSFSFQFLMDLQRSTVLTVL